MSVHYCPFQNGSLPSPKHTLLWRQSACSQEQATSRKCTQGNKRSLPPPLSPSPLQLVFCTELYKREQERKGAVGGEKGEMRHFPSARGEERHGGKWRRSRSQTSSTQASAAQERAMHGEQGKKQQQAGERQRECRRQEKRGGRSLRDEAPWEGSVFWWDRL